MFVKHISMSKGNPMCIKNYSYKVEFALRGAGHIHGVLWVDWENFTGLDTVRTELMESALAKLEKKKSSLHQKKSNFRFFRSFHYLYFEKYLNKGHC